MLAEKYLQDGDIHSAMAELEGAIRKNPAKTALRTFLFQMVCLTGDWKRCMTQLNVVRDLDSSTFPMVNTYKKVISCEILRGEVFAGKKSPLIFGDPEQWVGLLIEALALFGDDKIEASQKLRAQAFEEAPATVGTVNNEPFEWIADADSRLGPVMEAIINGKYYWAPFARIKSVQIEKPEDLRDLAWIPANFTWVNGGECMGFVPARYPGSENSGDPLIQLSRKTEWTDRGDELFTGLGQKIMVTDQGEIPLLEIRELIING